MCSWHCWHSNNQSISSRKNMLKICRCLRCFNSRISQSSSRACLKMPCFQYLPLAHCWPWCKLSFHSTWFSELPLLIRVWKLTLDLSTFQADINLYEVKITGKPVVKSIRTRGRCSKNWGMLEKYIKLLFRLVAVEIYARQHDFGSYESSHFIVPALWC